MKSQSIGQPVYREAYKFYKYHLLPGIKEYRGATRIHLELNKLSQTAIPSYDGTPESIFERDWDNLIILDACRHDTYQEVIGENVPKRITLGSHSKEYIQRTYRKTVRVTADEGGASEETIVPDRNDVVYITANPYFAPSEFEQLIGEKPGDVYHRVYHTYRDRWDDSTGTVLPESIIADAEHAQEHFPGKRKILHFMQPHYPFVPQRMGGGFYNADDRNVWQLCELGRISGKQARSAYRENLQYVVEHLHTVDNLLPGKTVVTADHGNLLGEGGRYGHPVGSDAKPVREVPWHVL